MFMSKLTALIFFLQYSILLVQKISKNYSNIPHNLGEIFNKKKSLLHDLELMFMLKFQHVFLYFDVNFKTEALL